MSADWDASAWSCTGPVGVKAPKAASQEDQRGLPAHILPPHSNPKDIAKRLKPEKWHAAFDYEGRPVGFHKLLKSICQGGVDHSIRSEVWEFLLGCYPLGTTAEYRQELRAARRDRYRKLIEQCRQMHSSIGTGTLAYTVGSKVMDVRIMSKDNARKDAERVNLEPQAQPGQNGEREIQSSDDASDSVHFDTSADFESSNGDAPAGFETIYKYSGDGPENHSAVEAKVEAGNDADSDGNAMEDTSERDHLPGQVDSDCLPHIQTGIRANLDRSRKKAGRKPKVPVVADTGPPSWSAGPMKRIKSRLARERLKKGKGMRIGDSARDLEVDVHKTQDQWHSEGHTASAGGSTYHDTHEPVVELGKNASKERVAEWLWILHKIVVDVVRTDRHLEFYGDARNMARMSDILAVYAWIDPDTGYCQGMSDLLSPFIFLFEDDADAFWCFESLLRRVRQNFQMEGPVGVMKQLGALSRILEVTDPQMSKHLTGVGADNFLFAFRMLLVLFRRELSFGESLFMWEMMWAADFNQDMVWTLELNCLEALVLRVPSPSSFAEGGKAEENMGPPSMSFSSQSGSISQDFSSESIISNSSNFGGSFLGRGPFCGLRPGALLTKNRQRMPTANTMMGRNGDEELSVFCVAAILVQNRNKLLREVHSMDDAIKTFNDMNLVVHVHSSIQKAIKLRKKYHSRLAKRIILDRRHTMTY